MLPNEHTRTSDVLARSQSSRDSTFNDFDPDNDALISTQQFDEGDGKAFQRDEELDYAINTSILNRALPPLTDDSEDESEAPSIEIGRGGRNISQRAERTHDSFLSLDDSKLTASPSVKRDELPERPLPRPALRTISNKTMRNQDNLRKDAQIRRASHVSQKENLDPNEPKVRPSKQSSVGRRPSKTHRRTLSDMHAKVSETYEGSYLSDERPANVTAPYRNTRFGSKQSQNHIERAVSNAAAKSNAGNENNNTVNSVEENHTGVTNTNNTLPENTNHESFILPDMPNLSELVSDIYQEDMPPKPRQTRSRTTRFASPPAVTMSEPCLEHVPFEAVPIPDDEKAIFASLKLLQDKISTLEKENSRFEQRLQELQQENNVLRAESSSRQTGNERKVRIYKGTEEEPGRGAATLAIERNRLEAANMALQNRLDIANHKISGHDGSMRRVIKERDTVMTKLGVAFLNCQELRSENEVLRRENEELQAQLSLLTSVPKTDVPTGSQRSKKDMTSSSRDANQKGRNSELLDLGAIDEEQSSVQDQSKVPLSGSQKDLGNNDSQTFTSRQQRQKQYEELFSLDFSKSRRSKSHERRHRNSSQVAKNITEKKEPNSSKQRVKKVSMEEDSDVSDGEMETESRYHNGRSRVTQDLTFLTFIDDREIARLRKRLEEERIARKLQHTQHATHSLLKDATRTDLDTLQSEASAAAPNTNASRRESIIAKEPTCHNKPKTLENGAEVSAKVQEGPAVHEMTQDTRSTSGRRRRQNKASEMTSAIIVPDITLRSAAGQGHEPIRVSSAAQRVLDEVTNHKSQNCFVCQETNKRSSTQGNPTVPSIKVPKPIPVSKRMPGPSAYNDEPTLRPSQPPSIALASVLKALEDELAHLKMQLTVFQTTYAKHDPSLGKRQRKALCQKIENLMVEIEKKSDQIYSLYDVLEGQKQNGEEMTDEQVEVTLHSLGIVATASEHSNHTERPGRDNLSAKQCLARDVELSDSDGEDLPWEGFESTVESTGRSSTSKKTHGR
ncbi:hypothetical protein PRK78_004982 [Emydomyces testavorans]|uniref:Cep57 centrosome microtubule-binding domain-containing protein n=1 Tax=Emydomyces testavorans TaxID=2070801 RepID=A0AAF0DJG8_9EURO|nr:hypothetical protein PRK78_004982 [Emydomyces testavorans]